MERRTGYGDGLETAAAAFIAHPPEQAVDHLLGSEKV
jgi:hypothetical protein